MLRPATAPAAVDVSAPETWATPSTTAPPRATSVCAPAVGELAEPSFASQGSCATSEVDFLKEVQPGESRSGCVAFDVPKGARPAAVRFSPEGRQASGRTWLVRG